MSFPPEGQLNQYSVTNASRPAIPFTVEFRNRDPLFTDVNYPIQKIWLNETTNAFWFLKNFYYLSNGYFAANWILIAQHNLVTESLRDQTGLDANDVFPDPVNEINVIGDGVYIKTAGNPATHTLTIEPAGGLTTLYTENTGTATPSMGNLNVFGGTAMSTVGSGNTITINANIAKAAATSVLSNAGVASFNSADFTVDGNGFVSSVASGTPSNLAFNYTNVTHAMSPYTVVVSPAASADYFISCDTSGGAITLKFPNGPTFKQLWIVKDRTGNASANNISVTTVGGAVTVDGLTTYIMNSNYQAINLLANSTPTYEVY